MLAELKSTYLIDNREFAKTSQEFSGRYRTIQARKDARSVFGEFSRAVDTSFEGGERLSGLLPKSPG